MTSKRISGLYAITPDSADLASLIPRVQAVLQGGARVLQYRNKHPDASHLAMAQACAALCRPFAATFIVNDDVALALAVDADGVHLGRDDGELAAARQLLGPQRLIGVSCYGDLARARQATADGADYVAFGSVFASPTKPHAPHAPLTLLIEARARMTVPIVAIGGITLQNAASVIEAGADAIAVIGAIFSSPNITNTAVQFCDLFKTTRSHGAETP